MVYPRGIDALPNNFHIFGNASYPQNIVRIRDLISLRSSGLSAWPEFW